MWSDNRMCMCVEGIISEGLCRGFGVVNGQDIFLRM